jgi:hypothetical protein
MSDLDRSILAMLVGAVLSMSYSFDGINQIGERSASLMDMLAQM